MDILYKYKSTLIVKTYYLALDFYHLGKWLNDNTEDNTALDNDSNGDDDGEGDVEMDGYGLPTFYIWRLYQSHLYQEKDYNLWSHLENINTFNTESNRHNRHNGHKYRP